MKHSIRIDWSELDYFGHVNNVSFFKYVQSARVNFWDKIGLTESHLKTDIGPLLASCKCDFKRTLHYPGNIEVETNVKHIGNTSFSFQHILRNEKGEIAAEAEDVMVMFDFKNNTKVVLTEEFKQSLNSV